MQPVHRLTATAAAVVMLAFGVQAYAQDSTLQFTQRRADAAQAAPGQALTEPSARRWVNWSVLSCA